MALKDIEKELYGADSGQGEEKDYLLDLSQPKVDEELKQWERKKPIGAVPIEKKKKVQSDFYQKRKTPFGLYIFVLFLIIILGFLGMSVYQKFTGGSSGVDVSFNTPEEILIFDSFELQVEYANNSKNLLRGATLVLELPTDFRSLDGENSSLIKRELGDLATNSKNSEIFNVLAVGEQNRVAKFKAYIQYNIPGFTSRFEKAEEISLNVSGQALGLDIVLPEKALAGEEFVFVIKYFNNTSKEIPGFKIDAIYPLGFEFLGSNIPPTTGQNEWSLGDLSPKGEGKIEIKGKVSGNSGAFFDFGGKIGIFSNEKFFDLGQKTAGLTILDSPLRLFIDSSVKNGIIRPGENITYTINYQNNTEIALEEVIIKTSLDGEMFDLSSIKTEGYFDSGTKRVIWNAGNTPELRLIDRGNSGEVSFSVKVSPNYPIRKVGDKNFTLKVKSQLETTSVPVGIDLNKTTSSAQSEVKVAGKIDFLSYALFRDAPSGIVNKGSLPLSVGKATNFTIHFKLVNYSDDMKDIVLRTALPQGVSWTDQLAGDFGNEPPIYNERTGEVEWKINELPAGVGVVLPAKELIFQVAFTPSVNQIGTTPLILKQTNFSAINDWTGEKISFSADGLDSNLRNDSTVQLDDGRVRP